MSNIALAEIKNTLVQSSRTLKEWLDWQENLHFTAIELGLVRCRQVADLMKLLPPQYYVISVAGTNGKGSCTALLDSILREAGYKTGVYSSPHLIRYNERIKIDGKELPDEILCNSFEKINHARGDISLTYFEFGTIAAIDIFTENKVDIAIMEVGMGGRLDAVNMIDANVSIISTIDIDHEQWLGNTRDQIAREKAGIFRPMRPAICGDPAPPSTIMEIAELTGSHLYRVGANFQFNITENFWSWSSERNSYYELPVPGNVEYQVKNAATVLMALECINEQFPVSRHAILNGLANFSIPGRFQVIEGAMTLVLDVAHNPQSAEILRQNIEKYLNKKRIVMVIGMLKDKNHKNFISQLISSADVLCLTGLDSVRGATGKSLESAARSTEVHTEIVVFDKLNQVFSWLEKFTKPGDAVIFTGSFVTVGLTLEHYKIGN